MTQQTKVALYARVSLDESSDDRRYQNPDNQLIPLRKFAELYGYQIDSKHIYIDKESGANPARKEFRRMMQDALMHRFSGILIWSLDRFSREGIIRTMSYIKQLKDRGIWVKSMNDAWMDTQDQSLFDLLMAIFAWASAEERRKISLRTKAGIERKQADGSWRGGRPKKGMSKNDSYHNST